MVTMKDIALRAGVSRPTVSLVLNGKQPKHGDISAETRDRILSIAKEMGYVRNEVARAMKTGGANIIGIVGGFDSDFRMFIVKKIAEYAGTHDFMTKLFPVEKSSDISYLILKCLEQRVSGIVICYPVLAEQLQELKELLRPAKIPVVLAGIGLSSDWASRVTTDDVAGTRSVLEFLLQLGHKDIACFSSPVDAAFPCMRTAAYRQLAKEFSLTEKCHSVTESTEMDDEQRQHLIQLLKKRDFTAVFCSNDIIALKVLHTAAELGISVPADLSVVGYGDLSYSSLSIPALTTVRQPFDEIGAAAAGIIMKNDSELIDRKLPVTLIRRKSAGTAGVSG